MNLWDSGWGVGTGEHFVPTSVFGPSPPVMPPFPWGGNGCGASQEMGTRLGEQLKSRC